MADLEWYAENASRSFPLIEKAELVETGTELPNDLLLDFGVTLGAVEASSYTICLTRCDLAATGAKLTFAGSGTEFAAVIPGDVERGDIIELEAVEGEGFGFVVIGSVSSLLAAMGEETGCNITAVTGGDAVIEPSRVASLYGLVVSSVSLRQLQRSQWAPPGEIAAAQEYETVAEESTGSLYFSDGYNCEAQLRTADNAVVLTCGVGLGEGEPPAWDDLGEPMCGDLISDINGTTASPSGLFTILGLAGFQLVADGPNRLRLTVADLETLYCQG
ncbi:MAG: hypothetical protein WC992_00100 [Acholeplasmataceae bacterium]|jgi:hypothetical protein